MIFSADYKQSYKASIMWALMWAAIVMMVHSFTLINSDNGWLLYAAKRMLAGDTPYVDFLEPNPPLILWIYSLPVYVAQKLDLFVVGVFDLFILLIAAISLLFTFQEIRRHPLFGEPRFGNLVFAALAQLVLGCSVLIFGQREHLFILFAMPYFVQVSAGGNIPINMRNVMLAVMAGIGLCLKPYFVLIWMAGEIYGASVEKNLRLLFRPTNFIIAGVGVVYIAMVAYFTPHYFETMLPYLSLAYHGFNMPGADLFKAAAGIALLYMVPLLFIKTEGPTRAFVGKLTVWFAAAIVTLVLQHKGWINHYYPMMFFGNFLLAALLVVLIGRLTNLNLKSFALLYGMGFVVFALPIYHLVVTRAPQQLQVHYISQLSDYVKKYQQPWQPMMVLSFNLGAAFPAVNYLPVTYPFHFHHQWAFPGIEADGSLTEARQFVTRTVTQDLEKYRPPLVIVEDGHPLDYVGILQQDEKFRTQWKNYRQVGKIDVQTGSNDPGTYTVLARQR